MPFFIEMRMDPLIRRNIPIYFGIVNISPKKNVANNKTKKDEKEYIGITLDISSIRMALK